MTIFRGALVTLLLVSAVAVNVDDIDFFSGPSYTAIVALIVFSYLTTVIYALWLRFSASIEQLAYAQFIGDAFLSGGLIFLTGGAESPFLFLFFLSIITASYVFGRTGALFSAAACSLVYALIAVLQKATVPALLNLSAIFGPRIEVSSYTAWVNIVAFYTVAVLAGQLAENLGQVGTELEQRRTDLRRLRALNENIVESIQGGLCTLDLERRVISFNRSAEVITSISSYEAFGKELSSVLPTFSSVLPLLDANSGGGPVQVRLERRDGRSRFVDVTVSPLTDAVGRPEGHILFFADVTEIRQLQSFLKRQERMAVLGKLSAAIAHEIRNPLASISGSIQVLQQGEGHGEQETALMRIVVREVDRLNTLIADFLSYARIREIDPQPVDLRHLIEDTALLIRQDRELCDDLEIHVELDPDPESLRTEGDPSALKQILWNLLRNAAEAMDGLGRVVVSARAVVAVGSAQPHVEIRVCDDGPGLSPEAHEHLFEPFFTTKDSGTGLGLAMVHRMVEAHGGVIWAETEGDLGGAEFRVILPKVIDDEHSAAARIRQSAGVWHPTIGRGEMLTPMSLLAVPDPASPAVESDETTFRSAGSAGSVGSAESAAVEGD